MPQARRQTLEAAGLAERRRAQARGLDDVGLADADVADALD
jgi:hypothetical protein